MRTSKAKQLLITLLTIVFAASAPIAMMPTVAKADTTVYITKTGECYHADGCSSLRKSKIPIDIQDAVDKGFRACSKCHPGAPAAKAATKQVSVKEATKTSAKQTTKAATTTAASTGVKTMPDGGQFDPVFYAVTYPDVVEALGTDEAVLYNHYLTSGKAEGRLPYKGYKAK